MTALGERLREIEKRRDILFKEDFTVYYSAKFQGSGLKKNASGDRMNLKVPLMSWNIGRYTDFSVI